MCAFDENLSSDALIWRVSYSITYIYLSTRSLVITTTWGGGSWDKSLQSFPCIFSTFFIRSLFYIRSLHLLAKNLRDSNFRDIAKPYFFFHLGNLSKASHKGVYTRSACRAQLCHQLGKFAASVWRACGGDAIKVIYEIFFFFFFFFSIYYTHCRPSHIARARAVLYIA